MATTLAKWDDDFEGPGVHAAPVIHNGIYTLTLPDGGHRTWKIHTRKNHVKFAPGKRVISLLTGPDNESDYEMVGFVDDRGIKPWGRFGHLGKFTDVIWRLATGELVDGYSLLVSGRCVRCNRTLTTEESIRRGIGDECWKKMGGGK